MTATRTTPTGLRFRPLPAPLPDIDQLPRSLVRRVVADAPHAYPCRRCLRDAEVGDDLVLFPYDPFLGDSPYRQPGPIFVHERECTPDPADLASAPEQLRRRQLSLRGFDLSHQLVATVVVEGVETDAAVAALLDDPAVDYVHVHNAAPGCFAVRVERSGG
ncbi:MAG: DUF1203 domain-containing protein [Actinomycetales bacterium]